MPRALVELRRVRTLDPEAVALVDAYCQRYGITGYLPPILDMIGAYDADGLAGLVGVIDTPHYRFVTDWAVAEGRRGQRASTALVQFVRTDRRPVVGWVHPSNEAARRWVTKNGGNETLVLDGTGAAIVAAVSLPPELAL